MDESASTVIVVLDRAQLIMVALGLVANLITVITLVKNGKAFSPAILMLLCHQSGIDAWVCFITIFMLVQPPMWVSGNHVVDLMLCQIWHGQGIYWMAMFVSIWNLVAIAFERYLAVCHPFKHGNYTKPKVQTTIAGMYGGAIMVMSGTFVQVHYRDGACYPEFAIEGKLGNDFFFAYSIFTFATDYAIPCTLYFFFYGQVIFAFRQRQSNSDMRASKTIDKATAELTKTAVVVAAIFIVSIGYEHWYYVMGYTGVAPYEKNSFVQKIGIFFASFNCVCNPFIYALLMPAYRKSVKMTFCSKCSRNGSPPIIQVSNPKQSDSAKQTRHSTKRF